MTKAVIDDGALYASLLLAGDIERVHLATNERSIVDLGPVFNAWDVQRGLLVTAATIGRPEQDVTRITLRDGSVYWLESDGVLRRMILGGGVTMTVAARVADYAIFEDRVLFISDGKLFWRRLTDTEPTFVTADVDSIGTVTSDGILITTFVRTDLYHGRAQVLRVSWSGGVLQTLQEYAFSTYHNSVSFDVVEVDGVVYIARTQTINYQTTLFASQSAYSPAIYTTTGPVWILDADKNGVTLATWGLSTGFHDVVQLECPRAPQRLRVVR